MQGIDRHRQSSPVAAELLFHWLGPGVGFFKCLQLMLFSLLTKTNAETVIFLMSASLFSWTWVGWICCQADQSISRFSSWNTLLKLRTLISAELQCLLPLRSEPKQSSPTQIYIYPSCLRQVHAGPNPAPTAANSTTVGSHVKCYRR